MKTRGWGMLPIEIVTAHNPWWETGQVPPARRGSVKRELLATLVRQVRDDEVRQAVVLRGPRRVGKTTLMLQLVDALLTDGVDPRRVVYLSCDDPLIAEKKNLFPDLEKLISERLLGRSLRDIEGRLYVLLDEIQAIPEWASFLKRYFDLAYSVTFIVSSSASLPVTAAMRSTLVGRAFDYEVHPFSLAETADLAGETSLRDLFVSVTDCWERFWAEPDWDRLARALQELERQNLPLGQKAMLFSQSYLQTGGFPEYLVMSDEAARREYFWSTVIERVVYHDVPAVEEVRDAELLRNVLMYVVTHSGTLLNVSTLATVFGASRPTVSLYLRYLVDTLLVAALEKYAASAESRQRAYRKVYVLDPGIHASFSRLDPDSSKWDGLLGVSAEINVLSVLRTRAAHANIHYWRERQTEVDFVVQLPNVLIPVEVKYRASVDSRAVGSLEYLAARYQVDRWLVVTKDLFRVEPRALYVPLWLFG